MRSNLRSIAGTVLAAGAAVIVNAEARGGDVEAPASAIYFAGGKYNRAVLGQQWEFCHVTRTCPGCMRTFFADTPNPFDNGDNSNCDGILRAYNWFYRGVANLRGEPWETFWLFSSRGTIDTTIARCRQSYARDTFCGWTDRRDGRTHSISEAYLVGTEFELGCLDAEIDRATRGDRGYPSIDANWILLRQYVQRAADDLRLFGFRPWEITTYGCGLLLIDASMSPPAAAPAQANTTSVDVSFARKCFIHALVAQQSWERRWFEPDFLAPSRIAPFADAAAEAPTFVWFMYHELKTIVGVVVDVRSSSWTNVKMRYFDKE